MTKLPEEITQQPGEPDGVFAIRLAAYNAYLEGQAIPKAVQKIANWKPVSGALHGWSIDAPLDDERLDIITDAHGGKPK